MARGRKDTNTPRPVVRTAAELRAEGHTPWTLARAVREGTLVRVRRGRYTLPGHPEEILAAARIGGRLDCVSLLSLCGVFVLERQEPHVQLDPSASRRPRLAEGARRHWRPSDAAPEELVVGMVEALVQSVRCQPPRAAIATLDSAWNLDLVDEQDIDEVFSRLPARFRVLRPLLDRRSEAGTETLVRLMVRALGCDVRLQVRIRGVGRVDLLVDGWLIIECDSRQFHGGWEEHRNDRRRDLAALGLGYATLRLLAEDVLFHPERVQASLAAVIARGAPSPNR
ncbi:hypothetical protein [Microbacterium sp. LMI1-1-1.1]|uniref:hypothetical protein n=1 Tax=Microbacterium sp. LMI1-1-1.1 TaxID=3135223 RepID=UPI003466D99D